MRDHGRFDPILGNPPWLKAEWNSGAFGAHIAKEIERWRPVLKTGNVEAD